MADNDSKREQAAQSLGRPNYGLTTNTMPSAAREMNSEVAKKMSPPGYDYAQRVGKEVQDKGKDNAREFQGRSDYEKNRAETRDKNSPAYKAEDLRNAESNSRQAGKFDRGSQETGIPSLKRGGTIKRGGIVRLHKNERITKARKGGRGGSR